MEKRKKANGYWQNYDICYNEAKKYKSKVSFKKGCIGAYKAACKNKWLCEYTWFEKPTSPNKKWTRETCEIEAKKYKTRTEFYNKNGSAYGVALKNGWLKEYDWFEEARKPKNHWNYDTCYAEAKKCESRADFNRKNGAAYNKARENGWLDDYTWFLDTYNARSKAMTGKHTTYTYEECFEIAKSCNSKVEFERKNKGAHDAAQRNGWLKKWKWFVTPTIPTFNPNEKYKIYAALFETDKSVYVGLSKERRGNRREWEHNNRKDSAVYQHQADTGEKAKFVILEKGLTPMQAQDKENYYKINYADNGWNVLNKADTGVGTSSLGGGAVQYAEEEVIKIAKTYETRGKLYVGNPAIYYAALRRGILDEMFGTERIPHNKKWVYETCQEEALKYETRTKFARANGAAYQASNKNGWIDEFFPKSK